jgi:hypothetical protein
VPKAGKYLSLLIIIAAVIIAGYLTGRYLSALQAPPDEDSLFEKQREDADYMAARPSSGPLIFVQGMNVSYENGHHATGILLKEEAEKVRTGQDVVLYDQEGYTLPLGGQVSEIEPQGDKTKITFHLPEGTNTDLLLNHVNIITGILPVPQRVPKSSVLMTKDAQSYIWVATPNRVSPLNDNTTYTLDRRNVERRVADADYVDIEVDLAEGELVVIEPDTKIKEGKKYEIFEVVLDAPIQNPIRQAYMDYKNFEYEEWLREAERLYQECLAGNQPQIPADSPLRGMASLPEGTTNYTCPANNVNRPLTPEEILNSLLNGNTGGGGCGTPACGQ